MTTRIVSYEKLSEIDHILCRPDMYVGSNMSESKDEYVAEKTDNGFVIKRKEIQYPPGLLRIFIEILSNAIDNVQRSRKEGIKCTKIKVTINKETGETSVWNDGKVIPIEKNSDGEYIHTMIFGQLRTSSNYNDEEERLVSGRNGMGGKVCCVFSEYFTVTGGDPEVKKQISQTWSNNMKEVQPPVIKAYQNVNGFTKITYKPDFKQFKLSGYTDDIINLYTKYIIDAAMLTRLSVSLNDEVLPVKTLQDYAKLYSVQKDDTTTTDMISITDDMYGEAVLITSKNVSDYGYISFVNGVYTMNGGKHVDAWSEAFFRPLVEKFTKKDKPQVTIKDIKQFFMIFVNTTVPNPIFESQSKTQLVGPTIKVTAITPSHINKISKWDVMHRINDIVRDKELSVLKKSENKRGASRKIEGVDHANNMGGKYSTECSFILCEGDSAKSFAVAGIDVSIFGKKGRDWFGIYKLRGKILNPRNATPKQISENTIITNLIRALNLRVGVDYTDDAVFSTLNYGRVIILVDQDYDGFHIGGLILNFFHTLYPSVMRRKTPYLVSMMTPIAKVFLPNETLQFYDQRKYDKYASEIQAMGKKLKVKYYKGLGSSEEEEVLDTYGKKIIEFTMDENTDMNMVKVFHKSHANDRKEWMEMYDPSIYNEIPDRDQVSNMSISDYLNHEVIKFSIDDCSRNIPCIIDGFKEGQRKIIYACFKKKLTTEFKVAQLAGYVAEHTAYHHGEVNLYGTITGMATCFVGSNNIPLLYRGGQMGTRLMGGKDAAAARYIFTKLETLTRCIFPEEDDGLLEKNYDDGIAVEPKFYVPIIPMVLVNGVSGAIGTGWSSNIPSYNPIDICKYIKTWIKTDGQGPFEELTPWYSGFTGVIEKSGDNRYITHGTCTRLTNNKVLISELPIGVWTDTFKEKIEDLVDEKVFKQMKNYSTTQKVHFEVIETADGEKCTPELLKLYSYLSTSNMVLFTEKGTIKRYENVHEILNEFCTTRLRYYKLRKDNLINQLTNQLNKAELSKRFLTDVMEDRLNVFKRNEKDIIKDMIKLGYTAQNDEEDSGEDSGFMYLFKMSVRSFSNEKITQLTSEINTYKNKIKDIKTKTHGEMWGEDIENFLTKYGEWKIEMDKKSKKLDKIRNKK